MEVCLLKLILSLLLVCGVLTAIVLVLKGRPTR